jgi:hypothetical protein
VCGRAGLGDRADVRLAELLRNGSVSGVERQRLTRSSLSLVFCLTLPYTGMRLSDPLRARLRDLRMS